MIAKFNLSFKLSEFPFDKILQENKNEPFYIRIQAAEEIIERGKFKPKKPEEMMGTGENFHLEKFINKFISGIADTLSVC